MREQIALIEERVNLRTILVVVLVAFSSLIVLYWSSNDNWWAGHKTCQQAIQQLALSLFTTVTIALLWELWGKRAFLDEILEKARISREIQNAGLVKVTDSFHCPASAGNGESVLPLR